MKVAVYAPFLFLNQLSNEESFIVETFFSLTNQYFNDDFYIIVDARVEPKLHTRLSPNINIITAKSSFKNGVFKKIWWDVQLPGILKKAKADVFISVENRCSLKTSIPQVIAFPNIEKIKATYLRKAGLILVPNKKADVFLQSKFESVSSHIDHIYPSAAKEYKIVSGIEKEKTKNTFSDGKEYFLFNDFLSQKEDFINLLKAFSYFKKRQQSSFKLLMFAKSNSSFEKDLATYKYRSDIVFIDVNDKDQLAEITGAAYAVVLPFNGDNSIPALNAMQSGVPVITSKDSAVIELAADAALYTETQTTKELGEKMMKLYTNETYRSTLIEKGNMVAVGFTQERSVHQLWQSILKLVP